MGDFFQSIGGALSSVLSGGVTGLLGIAIQRFADFKKLQLDLQVLKLKNEHEVAMKKADLEIMAAEWASRTKIAQVEASALVEAEDAKAFAASFNEPKKYSEGVIATKGQGWLMYILDFVRGMVRPGLTLYLAVLSTLLYLQIRRIAESVGVDPETAAKLLEKIIATELYLFVTCVTWWFGTRNRKKAPTSLY